MRGSREESKQEEGSVLSSSNLQQHGSSSSGKESSSIADGNERGQIAPTVAVKGSDDDSDDSDDDDDMPRSRRRRHDPRSKRMCFIGGILSMLLLGIIAAGAVLVFTQSSNEGVASGESDGSSDAQQQFAPSPPSVRLTPAPSSEDTSSLTLGPIASFPSPMTSEPLPFTNSPSSMMPTEFWSQRGDDLIGDANSFASCSVALSNDGKTVIIGSHAASNEDGIKGGRARVFVISDETGDWEQFGGDINGNTDDEMFGWSVSVSGDGGIIAVGAKSSDRQDLENAGHVRVYVWNGFFWSQIGDDIEGVGSNDMAGSAVALSLDGTSVVVGSPGARGVNNKAVGTVRVLTYDKQRNIWNQTGSDIEGDDEGDEFGHAVSLSEDGKHLAVGAPGNSENGDRSGQVQVFQYSDGVWSQFGPALSGNATGDESGTSVSISSSANVLGVGGPGVDGAAGDNSGAVRVFFWSGIFWFQLGGAIEGEGPDDLYGSSVSLASAGNRIVVGAPGGKSKTGYSQVFQFDSQVQIWNQVANNVVGDKAGDSSGRVVSLSGDGNRFAVGAILISNEATEENQGFTRIYDLV